MTVFTTPTIVFIRKFTRNVYIGEEIVSLVQLPNGQIYLKALIKIRRGTKIRLYFDWTKIVF